MGNFSGRHPLRWPTVTIQARCRAMLSAISDRLSGIDDDNRTFAAVVIVLGMLPSLLLVFVIFAK